MTMHAPAQQLPSLSNESLMPAHGVVAMNEFGEFVEAHIPGELPLTIRVDGMEVVTLMTLGTQPEALTLGYIRNQKLIDDVELITESIEEITETGVYRRSMRLANGPAVVELEPADGSNAVEHRDRFGFGSWCSTLHKVPTAWLKV